MLALCSTPLALRVGSAARSGRGIVRMNANLPTTADVTDVREWLEEVEGEDALAWVKEQNADAISTFGEPSAQPLYSRILASLESDEKIPYIGRVLNGDAFYNFWTDADHVRGIWRRCSLAEYRKPEPNWEVVLDLDALGADEGVSWVWGGSTLLDEGPGTRKSRVMVRLSRGGSDATVAREFDLDEKRFIPESEGGFVLPEAKSRMSYKDANTLIVGGVFGDDEMTDSGYPRSVYEWTRGTPLYFAKKVYEGDASDVSVSGFAYHDRGHRYEIRSRSLTFYTSRYELKLPPLEGPIPVPGYDGFVRIPVPDDAGVTTFGDQLMVTLRTPWLGHPAGALLAAPLEPFMRAKDDAARAPMLTVLFEPTDTCSLEARSATKNYLILSALDNVVTELRFWRYDAAAAGAAWTLERTYRAEGLDNPGVSAVDSQTDDKIWYTSSGYLQPTSLALADAASPEEREPMKGLPEFFSAEGLHAEQFFATSADGTKVPYFLVSKKAMKLDGSTPTLLYGYGGFEVTMTPFYNTGVGIQWLEKGYAYAVANIRGGGEYGPKWHQAALKENRNKAYEDFEAVAKDLVKRGVTTPKKLGCQGGSNGGLLTGNMLVRSPELFGAIVCQVPLLDMRRFHKLLAGASWMGEYGDPEEEWDAFLSQYSPYHLVDEATTYPPILFTTSTRDDRVHPGHARKMVRKLLDLGKGATTHYYENIEGGHGGAADNKQRAFMTTLAFTFLERTLAGGEGAPAAAPLSMDESEAPAGFVWGGTY